jgi:hypothetical protein
MPPICCYVATVALARHASKQSGPSAAIVQGRLTAIGTVVLAVFAIVTAVYAIRAFRKQSQEVSDQASMLKVQSDQLEEQRRLNAEQLQRLTGQGLAL